MYSFFIYLLIYLLDTHCVLLISLITCSINLVFCFSRSRCSIRYCFCCLACSSACIDLCLASSLDSDRSLDRSLACCFLNSSNSVLFLSAISDNSFVFCSCSFCLRIDNRSSSSSRCCSSYK